MTPSTAANYVPWLSHSGPWPMISLTPSKYSNGPFTSRPISPYSSSLLWAQGQWSTPKGERLHLQHHSPGFSPWAQHLSSSWGISVFIPEYGLLVHLLHMLRAVSTIMVEALPNFFHVLVSPWSGIRMESKSTDPLTWQCDRDCALVSWANCPAHSKGSVNTCQMND